VAGGPGDPNVIEADVAVELIPPREVYLEGRDGERPGVRLSLGQLSLPREAELREGRLIIHRDAVDKEASDASRPWHIAEVGEACGQLLVILAPREGGEGWTQPIFLVLAHDGESVAAGAAMGVSLTGHPLELEIGEHKMELMPGRAGVIAGRQGLLAVHAVARMDGRRVTVAHRASSLGAGERLLLVAYPQRKLGGGKPVRLLGIEDRALAGEDDVASR